MARKKNCIYFDLHKSSVIVSSSPRRSTKNDCGAMLACTQFDRWDTLGHIVSNTCWNATDSPYSLISLLFYVCASCSTQCIAWNSVPILRSIDETRLWIWWITLNLITIAFVGAALCCMILLLLLLWNMDYVIVCEIKKWKEKNGTGQAPCLCRWVCFPFFHLLKILTETEMKSGHELSRISFKNIITIIPIDCLNDIDANPFMAAKSKIKFSSSWRRLYKEDAFIFIAIAL